MSRKQHKRFKEDNTENSKGFERAKNKLAQEFKKISNRMKDRNHKLSRKLVNVFDLNCLWGFEVEKDEWEKAQSEKKD